jgi:phosphoglycerate kinase
LVRASLNVALDSNSQVVDPLRLDRTLETINLILDQGGIPILLSHIENNFDSTMKPVVEWFRSRGYQSELVSDYYPKNSNRADFQSGIVYVFENLRNNPGEKGNDQEFARVLASYGDRYVNESFDSAHRAHASIVSLPTLLPAYAGINFAREVAELSKVFNPDRPFLFIIGGAKFSTKAPLIRELLDQADEVFVGGALMNPLLSARGLEVGQSLMPEEVISVDDLISSPNLRLPIDFINQDRVVLNVDQIQPTDALMDIGPQSVEELSVAIENASLVVWNGPLGNYEKGFSDSTDTIVDILANSNTYSIIGGGDTLAAVSTEAQSKINWISTGGGAMLDFIQSRGDLPAIKVLK